MPDFSLSIFCLADWVDKGPNSHLFHLQRVHDMSFADTYASIVGANLLINCCLPFTSSIAAKCQGCPYSKGGDPLVFSVVLAAA